MTEIPSRTKFTSNLELYRSATINIDMMIKPADDQTRVAFSSCR